MQYNQRFSDYLMLARRFFAGPYKGLRFKTEATIVLTSSVLF